ncbi:predicted protein [Lichtheimia corymbifera JMRC:FSU:9682]|uniref:Uncharacterized protein n=1 Tax=Lichtheimia corymbifera JMRC:FSU:9682 TaxID=1263082 RepID=A0A068S1L4_9FUNG|nr:hypothetical protein K492DRAFT_177919 [Lichtheimia hyalospora FSU 10163]CDH56154.1 predicted protein [Lichtheimia corymbifera JMRC:FSU:9682]
MDTAWCTICNRHCADDNSLYCSEDCRIKDTQIPSATDIPSIPLSPPTSPCISYARYTSTKSSNYYGGYFLPSPPSSPSSSFLDT